MPDVSIGSILHVCLFDIHFQLFLHALFVFCYCHVCLLMVEAKDQILGT